MITFTKGIQMASDKNFFEFIVYQMGNAGYISQKKMFGEYAIYCDDNVVALVCDNQLYIKPTEVEVLILVKLLKRNHIPELKCIF